MPHANNKSAYQPAHPSFALIIIQIFSNTPRAKQEVFKNEKCNWSSLDCICSNFYFTNHLLNVSLKRKQTTFCIIRRMTTKREQELRQGTEPRKWHFTLFIIAFYRNINSFNRIIMSFYRIIIAIYQNNYSDISTYYCVLSNYYFDISKLLFRYIEIIIAIYWHIIALYRHIIAFYRIIMSFYRIIIAIYRNNYSDIATYIAFYRIIMSFYRLLIAM